MDLCGAKLYKAVKEARELDSENKNWLLLCRNKGKFQEKVKKIFKSSNNNRLLGDVFDFFSKINFSLKCHILNKIEDDDDPDNAYLIEAIEKKAIS